jgi:hypothetical protein
VARLKVKLEADRKQNILDAAEMKRLKNELNFALSVRLISLFNCLLSH